MTQKIEVIGGSLLGPHTIQIDGHKLTEVEDFELYKEDGMMKIKLVLITDNFQLRREGDSK